MLGVGYSQHYKQYITNCYEEMFLNCEVLDELTFILSNCSVIY